MPPCVRFSGTNGGGTMPGVTSKDIDYVWYESGSLPPALQAIGASTGLSYTPDQLCYAMTAYTKDLNKYWQLYGRKFVAEDGPGSHSGKAKGSKCHTNYFQGSGCGATDAACWRADADAILAMKPRPAFVIGSTEAVTPFLDELSKHGELVLGQGGADAFTEPRAPYIWDWQMSSEQVARIGATYFCKKLVGRPVSFAGSAVMHSGTNPLKPPTRKIGVVYDVGVPDTTTAAVKAFRQTLAACGDKNVVALPYAADLNQVPTEMATIASKIKIERLTTVYAYMDFISAIPLSSYLESEGWQPEIVISGAAAIDDDRLAQLMNQDVWRHTFGLSLTDFSAPEHDYDFYKAYQVSGEPGTVMKLANNMWPYFWMAGDMFQTAGPSPTISSIESGMFSLPPMGGTPLNATMKYGTPGNRFLGQQDVREVWYCPTKVSPEDNKKGVYVPVLGGRRFEANAIDGKTRVFPQGVCGV